MTTQSEVRQWAAEGRDKGAEFMIVVCDCFDYSDYPVYCNTNQVQELKNKYNDYQQMSRVMEIIKL